MVQFADRLLIDRSHQTPLYLQLVQGFEALIEEGALEPGERLPASRDLSRMLGVNRQTVTSAYEALGSRGLVSSHVGQGTFVSKSLERQPALRWSLSRASSGGRQRVRTPIDDPRHPDAIDFASLVPDEELFPVEPYRSVLDQALAKEGKKLLQYGPAAGHPPLRSFIADRLRKRGMTIEPENVLIVNGSQQALDLICRTLVDPGDRVVVESPTYTIILPLLAQYQARIDEVPMTATGIDLDALSGVLSRARPKFIFTMPTFHNPTGTTLDLPSRRRLLAIAAEHDVPVVEDDFDSELRFDGKDLPPLAALDDRRAVLHIGTFSKGLFPGVRLGWIVAPPAIASALERSKLISDYYTSLLPQAAVLSFCEQGHYDEHLRRLAVIYRSKSRRLTEALTSHAPEGVRWTQPEGGFAFWVSLPAGVSADAMLADSARAGVLFTPGSHFFAREDGRRFLRLSISRVPEARIEEGVRKLCEIIAQSLSHHRSTGATESETGDQEPALHI